MPLTTQPTKVDGSIGRVKTDINSAPNLDHYVPAAEFEIIKDFIVNVCGEVGNHAGAAGSLNSRVTTLESGSAGPGTNTATVAGTAANGAAATFLRSDATLPIKFGGDSRGDLGVAGVSGVYQRLPVGTNGYSLIAGALDPSYQVPQTSVQNSNSASVTMQSTDRMIICTFAGATAVHLDSTAPPTNFAKVVRIIAGSANSVGVKNPASVTVATVPAFGYIDVYTLDGTTWSPVSEDGLVIGLVNTQLVSDGTFRTWRRPNLANFRSITNASDTIAVTDLVLNCNRSGAIALSLPALGAPGSGLTWIILVQDVSGAAGTNNITITPATSINGAGTYVINTNYGAVSLRSTDGSIWTAA